VKKEGFHPWHSDQMDRRIEHYQSLGSEVLILVDDEEPGEDSEEE